MMLVAVRATTLAAMMVTLLGYLSYTSADVQLSKEELLRNKVLKDYDKMALPQRDVNGTTTVTYDLLTMGTYMEEDHQVLHLNAWLEMMWQDPRLKWDPKDYGDMKYLHLQDDEVWHPKIMLYNNADITNNEHHGSTRVIAEANGTIMWVPPTTFRAECPIDLTLWPYDAQTCHLFFGSWTRHGNEIKIKLRNNNTEVKVYQGFFSKFSHSLQIKSSSLKLYKMLYFTLENPYYILHLVVNLARNSPSFTSTVVIPAVVVSLLTLLQFILPIREPLRLVVGLVALILDLLALMNISFQMPPLAGSVPIIIKFFGQTLGVVVVSVGMSASLLRLTDTRHPSPTSSPPPAPIKTLVTGPLARILFLGSYTDKVGRSGGIGDDGEVLEGSAPPSYAADWLLVAAVVDRLALFFFIAIFIITLLAHVAPV